ncbi:hypothetical protein K439DRAFT_1369636 [Ramaria rubella]|nr:hypothetical protein K439DRAFT_1369636 [Ramaria rubella]
MQMRGIPAEYTEWICIKVEGRQTMLSFDGHMSDKKTLLHGLDQKCPLSRILYQFYNVDLLDIPN